MSKDMHPADGPIANEPKAMQLIEEKYGPQEPDKRADVLVVPGRVTQEEWDRLFAPKEPVMSDR